MGDDVVAKYSSQLADLKMNSKPLINLLTMMAEDYARQAPVVVQVIEKHLITVRSEIKLPVLYLIDSIIKNVKQPYVELFTQNIVSTFSGVFEKVDEKTRGLLWKLRGTWNDHFPQKKLYAIDVRCHQIDPKWPIMAPAPASGSIHVNPRFLTRGGTATAAMLPSQILTQTSAATAALPLDNSDVQIRAQLLAKQKELLELQTKKVELELLQLTKAQMEDNARRHTDDVKEIDSAVKQEQMLVGMAEIAKNRTEKIQLQLSSLQKPSSSTSSGSRSSPRGRESSSDRESLKAVKSESSGNSVEGGSPSKRSKSRDKGDRRERSKSDKNKDRHESKEKESRHRHRDNDRHSESKVKDKGRSHSRTKESSSISKASGEWKDYNAAKLVASNRSYSKRSGADSEENSEEVVKDAVIKLSPSPRTDLGSPKLDDVSKHLNEMTGENSLLTIPILSAKSPSNSSQTGENSSVSSGGSSPLKRRFPKDKLPEKDRRGKDKEKDKNEKNKEKPILSDPRLRRRNERERKESDENVREQSRESPTKVNEWKDYRERQQAVLKRSYRKTPGIDVKSEPDGTTIGNDVGPGDVDFRFETAHMDVDFRTETDGSVPEPPSKKSRPGKDTPHSTFDDLFGHQDVDLRDWTQVKVKSENLGERLVQDGKKTVDERTIKDSQPTQILRSPGPASPASSVASSRGACDPLGRPLVYNRLPNDPEERKRSLDSRSSSIDPVEQFKTQHIAGALQGTGILAGEDLKAIFSKAKEEHKQGYFTAEQYVDVVKQIVQASETSAMREVQQMQQLKGGAWQPSNNPAPNPWMTAGSETGESNIWSAFDSTPKVGGPTDFSGPTRFSNQNTWNTPWVTPNVPAGPRGPNPFEEAIGPMLADDMIPGANKKELDLAEQDVGPTIPIDKVVRQVRFYRDTSIVLMGVMGDDPRELSFQMDDRPRTVLINGKPLEVFLGETKKFDFMRVPHTIRIGTPGRELYIDDRHYEIFFGGRSIKVFLGNRSTTFQLLPPTPQVSVGQVPRYDLVAGRVNLIIDAVINVPVYLDEKFQKFEIGKELVVLKFSNGFQNVTLNGRMFPTNFGGRLPFTITLPSSGKHYLRFSGIASSTQRAIQAFVAANYGGERNDNRNNHFGARGRGGVVRGATRGRGRPQREPQLGGTSPGPNPWVSEMIPENNESSNVNPLDLFSNLFQIPTDSKPSTNDHSYESEQPATQEFNTPDNTGQNESVEPNVNVGDLVANLIKFGLLPATQPAPEVNSSEPTQEKDAEEDKSKEENEINKNKSEDNLKSESKDKEGSEESKPTIPPLPTVDVSLDDNFRERRIIAVAQIFTGVQCSQCGLRFPPDQTLRYSQHLDWHFRQNRREKANARKALSRKWYYDLSDWIQFEEIEDLEQRAASLFENQETENDNDALSPSANMNPEDYTVLASDHEGAICPQCNEGFESYFDEDREEWRLKNAKLDECESEAKLYHPICYQDYLKSLVEESIVEEENVEDKENQPKIEEEDDEVLIIKEGKKEVVVMEIDIDLDDDVAKNNTVDVIVNEEAPTIHTETKTDDDTINEKDINDIHKDGAKSCNDSALEGTRVESPILIDEDSTFLPGIGIETQDGVFGFALNSGIQRERVLTEEEDGKKIIYEPMKFDIPPIKLEPLEEESVSDDALNPDEFMSNLHPFLSSTKSTDGSEPMNIDLTEEDSTDAVDSGARLVSQTRTSIDGNLQHEEAATLPFIIAPRIRINISGMDTSSSSPKDKGESLLPRSDTEANEQVLVKDDGNENNIISNNTEINKDNPVDPVITEELKRLKPRLVGTKLTNYPPKITGKEESGLCVIC